MLGTRRDIAEVKNQKDLPVEEFKKYLAEKKKGLEEQSRLLGSDSRSIALLKKFIFLTDEKSALFKHKTYESLDEIEKVFKSIIENFKNECWALGVVDTHKILFDTLNLLLDWYKIKAIEAFVIYKPLAYEICGITAIESKVPLKKKFEILTTKIERFNEAITEQEQSLARISITLPDISEVKLKDFLRPLLREENNQSTRFHLFYSLDKFKEERHALEESTESLRIELKETISEFKKTLDKQGKERAELYDSQLDIDVYYLKDFVKENQAVIRAYHKILRKKEKTELGRLKEMSEWIEKMSEPYKIFQSSLSKSDAKNSSSSITAWWEPYYGVINYTHAFLKADLMTLQKCSPVFNLEKIYRDEFNFIRRERPKLERDALADLKRIARAYLIDISTKKPELIIDLRHQAEQAKEDEIEEFERLLQPSKPLPTIKPINYHSIRRDILDTHWRFAFNKLFERELQRISIELTQIKQKKLMSDIDDINKLELSLVNLRKSIDMEIELGGCHGVSSLVSEAFMAANNHPVMKDFRLYKQRLGKNETVEDEKVMPKEQTWYAAFVDKPWKKAVIFGLAVFVLVALAFTGWGLAVEASLSVLLITTLALGSGVGVLAGCFSYLFRGCCSDNDRDGGEEQQPSPSSAVIVRHPISPSVNDHKHSGHLPQQVSPVVSKKEEALTLGSWGLFGRHLARQSITHESKEAPTEYKLRRK